MQPQRERIPLASGQSFRVLRWTGDIRDAENILEPGKAEKFIGEGGHWHYHLEMELTLITAGEGARFVGDHIGSFAPGELVLLGERLPHYWHARKASSGISVQWHFPESHAFWAFPEHVHYEALFRNAGRGLRFTNGTARQIQHLVQSLIQAQTYQRTGILFNLLALMSEAPVDDYEALSVRSFSLPIASHYQQAVQKAVRHLIANFREEVRLEDVLVLTDLSRPTFARQFKLHTGRSFSEFLNELRIQATCLELRETNRPVVEIALANGFNQISFFNRLFRRMQKCSPTEYRDKHS